MFARFRSLRSKIFIGYLLVVLILVVVTLWSINNFRSLSEAINNIMVENYRSIKASESMIESIERQDSAILMMLNGPTEKGRETFRENEREFYKWLARSEDNITIEGEAGITQKIGNDYSLYINYFDEFFHQAEENNWEYYNQKLLPLFDRIKGEIRELRSINQETMVAAQDKANNRAEGAVISTGIISALAVFIALIFGIYLSNQILKPVRELENAVKKVAEKNFEQKIEVHSTDEIGVLAAEFNKMIERLQEYEKVNVSKLVQEKEKSEAIVNNITSPVIVTDDENRVVLLNQAARELFAIEEEITENYHFLELIQDEQLFEIISDNREDTVSNKTYNIEKDEQQRHYKVSSKVVKNREGEKQYTVTLLEDVTKLKEIDNLKSDFVSTVSHEFRTPLTSMNMGLGMLLEEDVGSINEEQRELLEAANEDCERLNDLVDDLLDLSRIESGKIKMEFAKASVKKIVDTTIDPFKQQAEEKGIELQSTVTDENLFVWADPNKISWVVSNLIGNALRYTGDGDRITAAARQRGRMVEISVEDTGIGIPEEYQERIFEKFFRASNNEDDSSGTGLGLAISREIIEAHNGSIRVESEEGEGSRFIFTLSKYRHLT